MFESNGTNEFKDIIIKKERAPVVKSEQELDQIPYEVEAIPRFGSKKFISSLQTEKQNIIQELLVVKSESQKLRLQLELNQKKVLESNRLLAEHQIQIKDLTAELESLKKNLDAEKRDKIEKAKIIFNLKRDKNVLVAQVKQLQSNTLRFTKSAEKMASPESSYSSENEFEVECILAHNKSSKRQREFFVRWKGYTADHDCWVKEKDLTCPSILKEYLSKHNLK